VARLSRGRAVAIAAVAVAAAVVLVLVVAGRRGDEPAVTEQVQPPGRPAKLVSMRPRDRRLCRASALLRPVCPRRVPAAFYPRRGTYLGPHGGPGERYDRFELIAAPASRPQHLALFASRYGLDRVFASPPKRRLGRPQWGGLPGVLVVDASRPAAGDHLVFRWRSRGVEYAFALAAWQPLRDAVATLRALVVARS
jgi:hypothetical protein